jgi:two-component system, cell cycle response regulator
LNQPLILLVDDEQFSRKLYSEVLEEDGYNVKQASSAEEAITILAAGNFDILVTDLVLPGTDGIELSKMAKGVNPNLDVIIITAHGSMESAIEALKFGVSEYLLKPINPEELKLTVKRLLSLKKIFRQNKELKSSNELMRVLNRISLCLETDQLLSTSVTLLSSFMKANATAFFEYDPVKNGYRLKAEVGLSNEEKTTFPLVVNKLHLGWEGRFSKAKVVRSPLLKRNLKKVANGYNSFLIIPLFLKEALYGTLLLMRRKSPEKFTRESLKVAKIISGHISQTLENSSKFIAAKELAFIDELTGLYNTRFLDYFMEKEIKRASRQSYPLSFLFMDIDFFKTVNDNHGHLVGSRLLIDVGRLIRQCVRDIDIIVRYGGDEYIIILVNTPPEGAGIVAERIRATIKNNLFMKEDLKIRITASFGIATFPLHAKTKEDIVDLADKAMYKAKVSTRDAVYIASEILK